MKIIRNNQCWATLKTPLVRGDSRLIEFRIQRMMRIAEAITWESGPSLEEAINHRITILPDGTEVGFRKPGKERFRKKNPNIHDMTPYVGIDYEGKSFEDIWSILAKAAMIDFEAFKKVLILIYRNAFHMDHKIIDEKVRYAPNENVMDCIISLNTMLQGVFPRSGLLGFLHFLDILGWNEDVKYHMETGRPTFNGKYQFRTGRINTLLTCIRVPYQMMNFIRNTLDAANKGRVVDPRPVFELMQQFAKSRGTCVPTNEMLVEWLALDIS